MFKSIKSFTRGSMILSLRRKKFNFTFDHKNSIDKESDENANLFEYMINQGLSGEKVNYDKLWKITENINNYSERNIEKLHSSIEKIKNAEISIRLIYMKFFSFIILYSTITFLYNYYRYYG